MSKIALRIATRPELIHVGLQRAAGDSPDAYTVQFNDVCTEVECGSTVPGAGWLRIHGRIVPYYSACRNGEIQVWVAGRTYNFEIVDRVARRATGGAGPAAMVSDLTAPMPGTILKIQIAAGEEFEAHQPLIIMESMKMEMTLSAPSPGQVKEIVCDVGQLVETDALLARLESVDGR